MTETTMLPVASEAESSGNRRNILLLGGLAAVVLAGGGYFLLAGGSSDESTTASLPLPQHRIAAPAKQAAAKAPAKLSVVPVTNNLPIGRNPFKVLYVAPAAAPATSTTTAGTSTTTTTTSGGSTTAAPKPTSYALVLSSVSGKTASFKVGGRVMAAQVGSVFGPTAELKLLSLTQSSTGKWIATIQEGDSDPIDVAQGQTVYVR